MKQSIFDEYGIHLPEIEDSRTEPPWLNDGECDEDDEVAE